MKKILSVLIVMGIMALLLLAGCSKTKPGSETQVMPEPNENAANAGADDSNTGGGILSKLSLAQAALSGKDYRCTATVEGRTSTFWIKKTNERIETMTDQGTKAIVIMKDKVMYSWQEGSKEGVMMDLEKIKELGTDTPATQDVKTAEEYSDVAADVDCKAESVSDSKFVPPTDVNFKDMAEMLAQLKEMQDKYQNMNIPSTP